MLETFDQVLSDAARRLQDGATNRRSPMHTPVVGTADADLRTMVLRGFERASWTLRFHTDARAPKVRAVERDPAAGVLLYNKTAKVQLRCRGTARIERVGEAVEAAWSESTNFARRCYLGEGPGAASDEPTSGLPPAFEGEEPDDARLLPARDNFAILLVRIETLDWFHLAHTGHRRALFDLTGDEPQGRWIAP